MHDVLIIEYFEWLRNRGCSVSTANQRLAAIKSFSEYAGVQCLECLALLQLVQGIKSQKAATHEIAFLSSDQIRELINFPDINTENGLRHRVILTLLYNSGCRVQELCDMAIGDIQTGDNPTVRLHGKGNKSRYVPLMKTAAKHIQKYLSHMKYNSEACFEEYLFKNHMNSQFTRQGVNYVLKK